MTGLLIRPRSRIPRLVISEVSELTVLGQRVVGHARSLTDVDAAVSQNEETAPALLIVRIEVDARTIIVLSASLLAIQHGVRRSRSSTAVHVTVVVRSPRVVAPYHSVFI